MMQIIETSFLSGECTCAATLMLPDGIQKPPVIVMAHGFANVRVARLPAFAERFVEAGYAAFLFDYRTFGDSEGEPRHWVHPGRQLEDWKSAVAHVRSLDEVDGDRVVAWGTSYSGGLVLKLGATDRSLAAIISHIPHTSGIATALKVPPMTAIKSTAAGLYDAAIGIFGRTHYSPITAEPGELGAIVADGAPEAYEEMLPSDATWENKVLSRSMLQVPLFNPRSVSRKIVLPVLMVLARNDGVVPTSAARRTARKIPDCTVRLLDADHFQPYMGEPFEESVAIQIEFLQKRVPVSTRA
jgi:dienelactone hydrolase